jgi:hypothetical protein
MVRDQLILDAETGREDDAAVDLLDQRVQPPRDVVADPRIERGD